MTPFAGSDLLLQVTYLAAAVLFILSLKLMSSPSTARHGVWAGEVGMLLAIVGTLLHHGMDYRWIAVGLVLGSIIGVPLGMVHMTAVPQRTALSHAFGALCVTLGGTSEYYLRAPDVPSVLIELGFVTNPQDLKLLTSDAWRARVADSMVQAIATFFATRVAGTGPAPGSN